MKKLGNTIKKYKAILRDGTRIPITESQYQTMRDMKESGKVTRMIKVLEQKTGNVLFDGEIREIKGFEHGSIQKPSRKYICNKCGNSVPLFEDCPDNEKHHEKQIAEWKLDKELKNEQVVEYKKGDKITLPF